MFMQVLVTPDCGFVIVRSNGFGSSHVHINVKGDVMREIKMWVVVLVSSRSYFSFKICLLVNIISYVHENILIAFKYINIEKISVVVLWLFKNNFKLERKWCILLDGGIMHATTMIPYVYNLKKKCVN